ncbi:13687_t:CDS:2, partial [Entrophospora sp. SA101]
MFSKILTPNRSTHRSATDKELELEQINQELQEILQSELENALEKEKVELRSEISSLKRSLYQAKKEIQDKVSYTDIIEKQLQESEGWVQNLRHRFKVISSQRSSPSLYNSEEEDTDMANLDLFIQI